MSHGTQTTTRRLGLVLLVVGFGLTLVGFMRTSAAAVPGGGNEDCPANTYLVAKFEYSGGTYVFEKPAGNEAVVTITNGTATGGDFVSTVDISVVVVKGGTGAVFIWFAPDASPGTSGSFSNSGLPPVGSGGTNIPDISNVQFCGPTTVPDTTTTTVEETTTTLEETTTTVEETTTTVEETTTTVEETTTTVADTTTTVEETTTTVPATTTTTVPQTTTVPATTTTTVPATTTTPTAPTTTATPTTQAAVTSTSVVVGGETVDKTEGPSVGGEQLPRTGGRSTGLMVTGLVLLAGGVVLLGITRQRKVII